MNQIITELEEEKNNLLTEIDSLKKQVAAIDKIIMRKKASQIGAQNNEVINKKNIDRILNEATILDLIRNSKNGLKTMEIYSRLKSSDPNINPNTVRTYITRMRDKGLIYKKKTTYKWILKNSSD